MVAHETFPYIIEPFVSNNCYNFATTPTRCMRSPISSKQYFPISEMTELNKVLTLEAVNVNVNTHRVDSRDFGLEKPTNINKVYVVEREGRLVSCNSVPESVWIKMITIARTSSMVNVLLDITQNGIVLRTVRPIYPGEPLYMWFGVALRTILRIPYLDGSNIYNTSFKCNTCNRLFSESHALLMHQALNCDSLIINHFWKLIATTVQPFKEPRPNSIEASSKFSPSYIFHPELCRYISLWENSRMYQENPFDPLQMEVEASNIGKTPDGSYQCRICLKKYSRKHGLKIHFRIHTGYKPLKCKICGRAFGDPSNLNKHVRLHENSEKFKYKCPCFQGVIKSPINDFDRHCRSSSVDCGNEILVVD